MFPGWKLIARNRHRPEIGISPVCNIAILSSCCPAMTQPRTGRDMKICQLCNLDFTLYHFLLPLMRAMRDAGHEVVGVCADGAFAARVREEGFRVETVSIHRNFNLLKHIATARELKRLFVKEQFDIVHVHNPVASLVGRFAAWRAGVPRIVYTAHGFYFHEHMPFWKRQAFISLEWLAGRVTDVLFTQAEEDAKTARAFRLIRGATIKAIGNGVDVKRFHPASSDAARKKTRRDTGSGDNRPVIMCIGRLVAEKGIPELIEAMKSVDADLWLVGERLKSDHAASVDKVLEAVSIDNGLKRNVHLLGYRADIPDLMRATDIFVSASHREGMPRSIIEAMMCALPVVATNIRGSREEVVDGETGFLVDVNDPDALAHALSSLADDPGLRRRLGKAGQKRALELYDERKVIARQIEALGL